jgi:hypothetical protein
MKTIHKFTQSIERGVVPDQIKWRMPRGAQILSAALADSTICVWAIVDPEAGLCTRTVAVRGTGRGLNGAEGLPFISTLYVAGHFGMHERHLFDGGES